MILVTGASGHFGGLTVRHLLDRVPASEITVTAREPKKARDLADRGVQVRQADFDQPATLPEAFTGADVLLLVSANGPDELRIQQHRHAVAAASSAGVGRIAYTSVTDASSSPVGLAKVHSTTEQWIRESGLPFTFLRNGLYHENYTTQFAQAFERGALVNSAGQGRVASASRGDLALAAAVVLTSQGHEGAIYELTGSTAWSFDELAAIAAEVAGKPLTHNSIPDADLLSGFNAAGLPGFVAELLVDLYAGIRTGVFAQVRPDLEKLIGRPTTPVEEAVREAL